MRALLLLAVALAASAGASAQCTTSWTNPAGGAWETPANWSDGLPDAADTACITLGGTYTVAQSGANRTVGGLVVGGASGTQTLTTFNVFTVSGDARVTPNGRWEVLNRTPGGGDGVFTTGTILVEGEIVQNGGTSFLTSGGVLDVAPGGTFRLVTSAGAGGSAATFRIRGLLEASGCPTAPASGSCSVAAPLDVQGGTVRAAVGYFDVSGGGTLHNATVDATAGSTLSFRRPGTFTVTGTLAGAPVGRIGLQDAVVRAGPGDATLALGGTGLVFDGSSGTQFSTIASGGGRFINTGLLTWEDSFAIASGVVIENQGTLRSLEGVSLDQGARLLNRAGGTWEIATSSAMGFGNGAVENAGLIVKTGDGFTNFGTGAGRLQNLPGAEVRVLNGRLDLAPPGSRTFPDGVTVTGTANVLLPSTLDFGGTVSPGTADQPLATLTVSATYRPGLVPGTARLVVDVDAGGASDVLAIAAGGGSPNIPRLAGALVVRVRPGYTPAVGDQWTVLTSTRAMGGTFSQVVAEGAPSGVAFVADVAANGLSVVVRAVETAPGGPITVSTTAPVGGAVRSVFLTGPGVVGVSAARLECTDCLDPAAFGQIPAALVGGGTLVEARFDLTSPRVLGFYTLVVQRPGQPDVTVPVTIRPFLSFPLATGGLIRGMRTRPPGGGYNWSHLNVRNYSNAVEPAYPLLRVERPLPERVSLALATGNAFVPGVVVFYQSDTAADPLAAPVTAARLLPGGSANLNFGLRISPEDVLFPEQTPTGPDDPRIPFGEGRSLYTVGPFHASFARSAATVEEALRAAGHGPLMSYLASVDATAPGAVTVSVRDAMQGTSGSYFAGPPDLLARILAFLAPTVTPPAGLAAAAAPAFAAALRAASDQRLADAIATLDDIRTASTAIRDLYVNEVVTLLPDLPDPLAATADSRLGDIAGGMQGSFCDSASGAGGILDQMERDLNDRTGGGGPGGGGAACTPPSGSADPNDKIADTDLACEFGTVIVDGEPETRCVRYYVPLARAAEPVGYTIQFENLAIATEPAELVTITDVLDPRFNPATLEVLGTSSDSTFSYSVDGQTVTFRFVGINLPPNVTAPEGEGYVRFRVSPRAPLPDSAEVRNAASIVFDFNPAIATPEVVHLVRQTADIATIVEAPDGVTTADPVAVRVLVGNLQGDPAADAVATISVSNGTIVSAVAGVGECTGTAPAVCTFPDLAAGQVTAVELVVQPVATGEMVVASAVTTSSFDAFAANDADAVSVTVALVGTEGGPGTLTEPTLAAPSPNPARGAVTLRFGSPAAGRADVRVFDLLGREVAVVADGAVAEAGWTEMTWDAGRVASGVYVVRFVTAWEGGTAVRTRRVVVVR